MRLADRLRLAIYNIVREEQSARPRCVLAHSVGVDKDSGEAYIHFTCLEHDATWRVFISLLVSLTSSPTLFQDGDPPCPVHGAVPVQVDVEVQETLDTELAGPGSPSDED